MVLGWHGCDRQLSSIRDAAPALGLTVLALEVKDPDGLNRAFAIL
jgi:hypothetical protein